MFEIGRENVQLKIKTVKNKVFVTDVSIFGSSYDWFEMHFIDIKF